MVHAARGTRETLDGSETIEDESVAAALRRRAQGVWIRTLVLTVVGTGVILALPT